MTEQAADGLIGHFESYLGPIVSGWVEDATGRKLPFQIARFEYEAIRDCVCFCTLGLSRHALRNSRSGNTIRMELFMMLRSPGAIAAPHAILDAIGTEVLSSHEALLPGDVVGPRGPLWDNTRLHALYLTTPSYLPDEFGVYQLEGGLRGVVGWLVPITAREAAFARQHGRDAFEDLLVAQDPDLLVLDRADIRLPP